MFDNDVYELSELLFYLSLGIPHVGTSDCKLGALRNSINSLPYFAKESLFKLVENCSHLKVSS